MRIKGAAFREREREMSLQSKTTTELCQIAAARAGFEIEMGNRPIQDLCSIAANAAKHNVQVVFRIGSRSQQELLQVAASGNGMVSFKD